MGLSMIDRQQVQAELNCARQARRAAEAAGSEMENLVEIMQRHAWQQLALVDDAYDPMLVPRAH